MDNRTFHEVYLWPWIDGVKNALGSAMCVMNRVNGTIGCEMDHIQNTVLKGELDFCCSIVPDATASVNCTCGLLSALDWNSGFDSGNITALIRNRIVTEEVIPDHAIRLIATQLNFNPPQQDFANVDAIELDIVRRIESRDLIRKAASECTVILKNEGKLLR